jgi:uncharacterized repeat protein (TIGR01451 family)/LPXTG-motif cell wall-anchored protein
MTRARSRRFRAIVLGVSAAAVAAMTLAVAPVRPVQAAEEECTPTAGFNQCVRFTFEGSDQVFTVPEGVTTIDVRMWGAGGAGDTEAFPAPRGLSGGPGGYTTGTVAVTPGQELTVTVGEGGVPASTAATYGGGGAGGGGFFPGSSGGGMSALWNGASGTVANALLMAGGGGGISVGTPIEQDGIGGGAGGGEEGSWDFSPTTSGTQGTQTAGGTPPADTTGCATPATAGGQFQGGTGGTTAGAPDGTDEGGGGGGGGLFGGGGGRCQDDSAQTQNGAGGGGSGFIAGDGVSGAATEVGIDGDRVTIGQPAPPPGVDDEHYMDGAGVGAFVGNGGNGDVVIQYNLPPQASIAKTVDNAEPAVGDTITYTVTVTNTGEVDFPGMSYTDDLSDVLDDATFNNDAQASVGTVSFAEPILSWAGDLPVGGSVTVTYSVTVTGDGDGELTNAVVADVAGTNCSPDALAEECVAIATVQEPAPAPPGPGPQLPATGSNSGPLAAAGAGLVAIGALSLLAARRRRTAS